MRGSRGIRVLEVVTEHECSGVPTDFVPTLHAIRHRMEYTNGRMEGIVMYWIVEKCVRGEWVRLRSRFVDFQEARDFAQKVAVEGEVTTRVARYVR